MHTHTHTPLLNLGCLPYNAFDGTSDASNSASACFDDTNPQTHVVGFFIYVVVVAAGTPATVHHHLSAA